MTQRFTEATMIGLSVDQIHEVYRKIANGERKHGEFLTAFAKAYILADPLNAGIMFFTAAAFIEKYNLAGYAMEPPDDFGVRRSGVPEPPDPRD